MRRPTQRNRTEGLALARFFMVLSSFSPLFILWAIRGTPLVSDWIFAPCCLAMIIIPNAVLFCRAWIAKKQRDSREVVVGSTEDHRAHILVYLFALLLPFYSEDMNTWRAFFATFGALAFVLFLFWHLNLHYMNILFSALGLNVFSIYPPPNGSSLSGKEKIILITRRRHLAENSRIIAYRLSNTVYWEKQP